MIIEKRNIKKHFFICTNQKAESFECCANKDASKLLQNLKLRLREEGHWDDIKVTSSGCLGPCSDGVSATLYPDNLLLKGLSLESESDVYSLLIGE